MLYKDSWGQGLKGKAHTQSKQKMQQASPSTVVGGSSWNKSKTSMKSSITEDRMWGEGGLDPTRVVRAVKEIRSLITPHPTRGRGRKQQMAQPQAAGRDSSLCAGLLLHPGLAMGRSRAKSGAHLRWKQRLERGRRARWHHNQTLCHHEKTLQINSQHYARFSSASAQLIRKVGLGEASAVCREG